MSVLKERLQQKIEEHRPRTKKLMKDYCDVVIDEVTVAQAIGGMRGLKSLVTDISYLDPQEGIRYRGYTLPEVFEKLPKPIGAEMPYVEGLYFLLLTGDIPTDSEVADLVDEFRKRRILPRYVYEVIDAFPSFSPPMAIFSAAILTMQRESFFAKKYQGGISKSDSKLLLMYAFLAEVTSKVSIEALRISYEDMIKRRLRGELSICESCVLHCSLPDKPVEFEIDMSKI